MAKRRMPNKNTNTELRSISENIESVKGDDDVKKVVVFNCRNLNVRKEPEKKDNILFLVPVGERLNVLNVSGSWSFVKRVSGKESGWVLSEYLKSVE